MQPKIPFVFRAFILFAVEMFETSTEGCESEDYCCPVATGYLSEIGVNSKVLVKEARDAEHRSHPLLYPVGFMNTNRQSGPLATQTTMSCTHVCLGQRGRGTDTKPAGEVAATL